MFHSILADAAQTAAKPAAQTTAQTAAKPAAQTTVQSAAKPAAQTTATQVVQKPAAQTTTTQVVQKPAAKQDTQSGAAGGLMSFVPMILIFVVLIFFMNRSQKKQQEKRQEMLDRIAKGTPVLLNSGVYGKVVEVQGECFIVEIADKVQVRVAKNGVACIEGEDSPDGAKKEAPKKAEK